MGQESDCCDLHSAGEEMGRSNLDCFLVRTTPVVPSHLLPKSCLNNEWHPVDKDVIECFNLRDLWDCYDEWSAYGVGSPIKLANGETVVQYYTPYLSAIQIYTANSAYSRYQSGESDEGESETNSWSSENEERKLSRSSSSNSDRTWETEELEGGLEAPYLPTHTRFGELYLEHLEGEGPFWRIPLKDKIDALSKKYPGLRSLNSVDLSPASWMAVAWYPIYNIPDCRNARELYASFLTYHTLSSSFQDDVSNSDVAVASRYKEGKRDDAISLPPFGLATYRMQPRIWLDTECSDHERVASLMSAADSWLKQLKVLHHDFNFFASHGM